MALPLLPLRTNYSKSEEADEDEYLLKGNGLQSNNKSAQGGNNSTKCQNTSSFKMSQDAEDGPEVLFYESPTGDPHSHLYNTNRPPMNQDEFDKRFNYRPLDSNSDLFQRTKKFFRHYYRPCLSGQDMVHFIFRLVPILNWLPKYSWRECLIYDAIGGLIVGIMHVPQGIAYASLAGVETVVGLYTSFLPPLFYMIFGTSRHNSIGSFAVVSLMTGMAVSRFIDDQNISAQDDDTTNSTMILPVQNQLSPVQVSSTLAFTVGLVQIIMGILRLELITTYFSDQLVAGFTTGASMHVFTVQLKDIFGLYGLPKRTGPGYIFAKLYDIAVNIHHTNLHTLFLAMASILFLSVGKEFVNPLLKRRFAINVPIPFELILMVLATAFSKFFHFHSQYDVRIVDRIPTGIPSPILPDFSLIPSLLPDAFSIAAVVIAVHISLAKMFAKKMDYRVDPAQEFFALGFSSSLSSFFPVYPVSCSLGRTLVNVEASTKTQLSTIFSSILLASIILYFGQWLRTLPMCILAAIIIVALKGIFQKITDLRTLWPLSKIDFSIWLVSFLTTVCWDVTQGLIVSICFALMTTVFRTQWPRWHFLANLSGTNDFRDAERYELVCTYPGICIFRFDSPLLFTNVDNFRDTIHKAFRRWNRFQSFSGPSGSINNNKSVPNSKKLIHASDASIMSPDFESPISSLKQRHQQNGNNDALMIVLTNSTMNSSGGSNASSDDERECNNGLQIAKKNGKYNEEVYSLSQRMPPKIVIEDSEGKASDGIPTSFAVKKTPIFYRHFIIDCSGFTFVDCMGVNALKEIFTEMRNQSVLVYFAATKAPVRDLFEKCGFYQYVQKHNFYPTIRDAVAIARKRRNASTQHLLDEHTERKYDVMEIMRSTQPMN